MTVLKNVAIAGASGNLGPAIVNALLESGDFNVTAFKRASSKSDFPAGVKVVEVDYDSLESLTSAMKGQDAVVSTLASLAVGTQLKMVDAAAAAGVKRFLPSEFGSDTSHPKTSQLPIFGNKVKVIKHLEEVVKEHPGFTYTLVRNNAFADWGLENGFIFNMKEYKPTIYDSGDQEWSMTALPTIGKAVVGVLSHPDETANRGVYIQDRAISAHQILAIAKRLTPGKTWEPVYASTAELKAKSDERLKKGLYDAETMVPYLFSGCFAEGWGNNFSDHLDNKLLGIKEVSDADLEALVKEYLPKN